MTMLSGDALRAELSRRAFLGYGAAFGALGIAAPALLATGARAATPDGEVLTGSHWGAFRAKVEGGRVVSFKPWEKDPAPSHQLAGVLDSIYSPTRIKYPMVRRAFLEKGPGADPDGRGTGDFVRVTWDQALDLVVKELLRVEKTYGPAATFAGSYGWKSPGRLHNCQSLLRRMMNLKGNFVNASGDYSTGAAQIIMPHVVGSLEVYEQQTVWPIVVDKTELMVFWGCDPVLTNQISWSVADHGGYEGMKALKAKGAKVICIDPVKTDTAEFFGAEWIAPRPQTDVALMLGIAHTLVAEKLHDEKFLKTYANGFDKFLPYLMGDEDKTPKSAEWASAICDIPADAIKDLARRFAKNRTMLASGWSLQRQQYGEQRHWMLVTLAAMLGQIGLPGGGFGFSYHYASGGAPSADAPVLTGITDGGKAKAGAAWMTENGAASIPVARVVEMLLNPGKEFDFNGVKAKYPDVKMAYWVGGNPFVHHQDRNRMVAAWKKLETFIVQDFQWTPTARFADIILPATTSYERNDIDSVGDMETASAYQWGAWPHSDRSELEIACRHLQEAQVRIDEETARVFERTRWGRDLTSQLESAAQTVRALQLEVEDRNEWARHLDSEVAAAASRIQELQETVTERTEWAARLDRERTELIAERNAQIARGELLDQDLETCAAHIAKLDRQIQAETRAHRDDLDRLAWAAPFDRRFHDPLDWAVRLANRIHNGIRKAMGRRSP